MIWWTGFIFSFQKDFLKSELGLDVNDPDTILTERLAIYLSHSHPITHGAWQYLPNIVEVRKKWHTNVYSFFVSKFITSIFYGLWGLCQASSVSQSFAIIADSENITVFSIDWRRSKTDGHKFRCTSLCQVGGLQLKDAQPLEGKLKEFMDSATGDTTLHLDVMLIFSNTQ